MNLNNRTTRRISSSSQIHPSISTFGVIFLLMIVVSAPYSFALRCFECSSEDNMFCPDTMGPGDEDIVEFNACGVYEGNYCVKTTGVTGVKEGFAFASNLLCFVCDDSSDLGCSNSNFLHEKITSCRNVFDAQYCIKTEGLWGGSLGTRRFCSSRDMGNYCDFIKRPGDQLEYRSCVYTCTGDGCNKGERINNPTTLLLLISSIVLVLSYSGTIRMNLMSSLVS